MGFGGPRTCVQEDGLPVQQKSLMWNESIVCGQQGLAIPRHQLWVRGLGPIK